MKSFKIISHTADVRLNVCGDTIESLFEAALNGLVFILQPDKNFLKKEKNLKIELTVNSFDETALLIDFLSEALTQMYIKNILINKVNFSYFSDNSLSGTLTACPVERFAIDIKAVTYNEAEIKLNELNEYECTVVLDI
jgi:SHS2 domain-containing protein